MTDKFKITSRQARVLAAIVKENVETAEPVASKELVDKGYFDISGPTVRNDMQVLEKQGLIYQPHTSSGRLPTDAGYRYFITELMKHVELSRREQDRLKSEIRKLQQQHYELGRTITKLLAESSHSAAFALLPEAQATSGFSNIVASDLGQENLQAVARFLDNLEQGTRALALPAGGGVKTFIGKESPLPVSADVSMVVTQVKLPSGKKGVVGIVGSKRMKYAKNISLLEYVSKLVSGGLAIIVFTLN